MHADNVLKYTRIAYNDGKLYQFIRGDIYEVPPNAPVNIPTDWTQILHDGIYRLYIETEDVNIISAFEQAVQKLIDGSATDFGVAVYVLFNQYRYENLREAPFCVNRRLLNECLLNKRNDDKLLYDLKRTCYGSSSNEDMYFDICRLEYLYQNKFGVYIWK